MHALVSIITRNPLRVETLMDIHHPLWYDWYDIGGRYSGNILVPHGSKDLAQSEDVVVDGRLMKITSIARIRNIQWKDYGPAWAEGVINVCRPDDPAALILDIDKNDESELFVLDELRNRDRMQQILSELRVGKYNKYYMVTVDIHF